jgi:hypothetical protein
LHPHQQLDISSYLERTLHNASKTKRKTKRKWEHQRKNQGGFSTYNKEAIQTLKILIAEIPTQKFLWQTELQQQWKLCYGNGTKLVATTKSRVYQPKLWIIAISYYSKRARDLANLVLLIQFDTFLQFFLWCKL